MQKQKEQQFCFFIKSQDNIINTAVAAEIVVCTGLKPDVKYV